MPAAIRAARSALEMVAGGEDHMTALIQIGVGVQGRHSFRLRENGPGVVEFAREPGDGLETGAAKTAGFESIRGESAEDVIRHEQGPL